jgi:tetratricopeptide (TPR) repeat protein
VYAVGAPEGFELTLSEGLISSLRPFEGVQLIQTTAPISRGSSGGGLFDAQGRLIGITTFYVKEGQNLNFALPGEWVEALPTHPAQPAIAQGGLPALNDPVVWFYLGVEAAKAQAWALAVSAFREAVRLKPDLAEAWYNLGVAYSRQGDRSRLLEVYQQLRILNPTLADEFFRKVVRP